MTSDGGYLSVAPLSFFFSFFVWVVTNTTNGFKFSCQFKKRHPIVVAKCVESHKDDQYSKMRHCVSLF